MTVYVGALHNTPHNVGKCSMIADSLDELHALAYQAGVDRGKFRGGVGIKCPSYSLPPRDRSKVVRLGAVEISRREMVDRSRRWVQENTNAPHR